MVCRWCWGTSLCHVCLHTVFSVCIPSLNAVGLINGHYRLRCRVRRAKSLFISTNHCCSMCHKPHMTSAVWGWGGSCILYIGSCDNKSYEEGVRVVQKCRTLFPYCGTETFWLCDLLTQRSQNSSQQGQWQPCKPEGVCRPVETCYKMPDWRTKLEALSSAYMKNRWNNERHLYSCICFNSLIIFWTEMSTSVWIT